MYTFVNAKIIRSRLTDKPGTAIAFEEVNWILEWRGAFRFTVYFISFRTFWELYHLHVLPIHKIKLKNKRKYVEGNRSLETISWFLVGGLHPKITMMISHVDVGLPAMPDNRAADKIDGELPGAGNILNGTFDLCIPYLLLPNKFPPDLAV